MCRPALTLIEQKSACHCKLNFIPDRSSKCGTCSYHSSKIFTNYVPESKYFTGREIINEGQRQQL